MQTTTKETAETMLNGVNVTRLGQTLEAIRSRPDLAQFQFRARNQWDTGSHSQASIDGFHGACQEMEHKQPFTFDADEPAVLLGEDTGANPGEYILAGLSGCMTSTLAYHAAGRGLKIDEIRSEYEGDVDLQGFLALDPNVRPGYREIRVKLKVKGDVDEATIRELLSKSSILDTISNPVRVKIEVEKI